MASKEAEAKQSIIQATMKLIQENEDVKDITVRHIAKEADVGVGLINYHFQSKDNLIAHCVQLIIGNVIDKFDALYRSLDGEPIDKLRVLVKSTATFMVRNKAISRISLLTDLTKGQQNDNSIQSMCAYLPVLREIYGDKKSDTELKILLQIMIGAIQVTFLRSDTFQQFAGMDFYVDKQRNEFIDRMIDELIVK